MQPWKIDVKPNMMIINFFQFFYVRSIPDKGFSFTNKNLSILIIVAFTHQAHKHFLSDTLC